MEKSRISRRHFVSGAAAAVTGAGLLTARQSQAAPSSGENPTLPPTWSRQSDVVIVGFGAAGAAAAYEAAAAGASVTILDTSAEGGGDTAISGGYVFIGGGTALQQAAGYRETPEQMFTVVRAMGGEGAAPDIIRVWCESGPELFQWLSSRIGLSYDTSGLVFGGMERHAEFKALAPNGMPVPHSHVASGAAPFQGGAPLFAKLSTAALSSSRVTLHGHLKATRLIQNPLTKRIVGVAAQAVDDNGAVVPGAPEHCFRAAKGVVIATGAFGRDRAMMARHSPNLLYFTQLSQANADGSGIRMAELVGGDVRLMKAYWALVMFAAESTTSLGILVSTRGSRFVAEDGGYTWLAHYMIAQEQTAYLIYDQLALGKTNPGQVYSANTIEELADAINSNDNVGMSRELLAATVAGYNALANEQGQDPAFLKDSQFVQAISAPPFYAAKHTASEAQGTTGGGLRVSTHAEVLDANGTPIHGLYAAGTCASLTLSERYTGGGTAIAGALVFGRIAGQQAASRAPWSD